MHERPSNPFILGKYPGDKYFCDRHEETHQLNKHIENGNNVVLISPRRMGKTGLIQHFYGQKEIQEKYYTSFIDIYATKNLTEFVYLLANSIYRSIRGGVKQQVERFFKGVSSLRLGFTIDSTTGEPMLDLRQRFIKILTSRAILVE